jgi:hypothetical protein
MHPLDKAVNEINRLLGILKLNESTEVHLRAYEMAVRLEVPEVYVHLALAEFAFSGMRLSTWSQRLWREIRFQEWPTAAFFNNVEDNCYVRLRPAA